MSAIFNGTTSFINLVEAIVGSTPTYPVLILCWVKLANITADHTAVSIGDNAAAASVDEIQLRLRGNAANDPTSIISTAAGAFSLADVNGNTADAWLAQGAYQASAASRQAYRGGTLSTAQTTTRNVTGLSQVTVGATRRADVNSLFLNGRMAELGIWSGIDATAATTIVMPQFLAGIRPPHIGAGLSTLVLYQPFVAGVNEATKVGSDMTESNMTYDANDHPTLLYPRWRLNDAMRGSFVNA
jgi:hypothetical protein